MSDDIYFEKKELRNQSVNLAIRYAMALMVRKGQLTVDEIEAIPYVTDENIKTVVIQALVKNLDVQVETRRRSGLPSSDVIKVIKLRRPVATVGAA